jgi:hypothetical protein
MAMNHNKNAWNADRGDHIEVEHQADTPNRAEIILQRSQEDQKQGGRTQPHQPLLCLAQPHIRKWQPITTNTHVRSMESLWNNKT